MSVSVLDRDGDDRVGSVEKPSRRTFSADYKLKIVKEMQLCKSGEFGALLRREGLYKSQVYQWRKAHSESGLQGLTNNKRGPARTKDQKRIESLEKEIDRLRGDVDKFQKLSELAGNALALYEIISSSAESRNDS